MKEENILLSLDNVSKLYKMGETVVTALDGVSFNVERGEFLSIMGPSGSGKSTCMNLIGCLDKPTSGEILINGKKVSLMNQNQLAEIRNRTIGFVLGPRINAAGRLAHASLAIELLSATSSDRALELATQLNDLNNQRKQLQTSIYDQAIKQVDHKEPVAVAVGENWHEGVIGIVASKIQEAVEKPTFVFSLTSDEAKASGRSFGDFSVAAAINATSTLLIKGGGHAAAGGVTVARAELVNWTKAVNDYYRSLRLTNQTKYLYPEPDIITSKLSKLTVELVMSFKLLEPFGAANPVPVVLLKDVIIFNRRLMGSELNHVRYTFMDDDDARFQAVAFGMADRFTLASGEFGEVVRANVLMELSLNEWNGEVSVQGKLLRMDKC